MVKKASKYFPRSLDRINGDGRLPLHIATRWGASPKVIKFLIKARPDAALAQDNFGNTPLHLTCKGYHKNFVPCFKNEPDLKVSLLQIVQALLQSAPKVVNLENEDDMTALEYAITGEVDREVVRLLHEASLDDWKMRHSNQIRRGGHEAAKRSLMEQQLEHTADARRMRRSNITVSGSLPLNETVQDPNKNQMFPRTNTPTINFRRNSRNATSA